MRERVRRLESLRHISRAGARRSQACPFTPFSLFTPFAPETDSDTDSDTGTRDSSPDPESRPSIPCGVEVGDVVGAEAERGWDRDCLSGPKEMIWKVEKLKKVSAEASGCEFGRRVPRKVR